MGVTIMPSWRNRILQNRVVFTMTLKHMVSDGSSKNDNKTYDNLAPQGGFYAHSKKHREYCDSDNVARYNDVRDFCERVINEEIIGEIHELTDIPIKEVKVNRTYEGSLIVVFSVLFNVYQFISGIAGFRDTIVLIENTVRRHMKKRLDDEFRTDGDFEVMVNSEKDNNYSYVLEDLFHFGFGRRGGAIPIPIDEPSYSSKRDGLFWYLLISNVVLLILLGILVSRAVISVYW